VGAVVHVRSAAEMHEAVMRVAASADVVIMAAAVADYTPQDVAPGKIAMRAAMRSERPLLVGFAAETSDVVAKARDKRARKQVDLVVANDVSKHDRGFDAETNAVTLVGHGIEESVPLQRKEAIAAIILDRVETLLRSAATA
jgi:phosphopantothenoylcysteine decarboxylase/phosphopantothenate--cysteine ligase